MLTKESAALSIQKSRFFYGSGDHKGRVLIPLIHTWLGFQQVLYFADSQDKSTGGG
jgi:hypothetical protein